jgi:hypothetical protein
MPFIDKIKKSWTNADYADVSTNSIHQGTNSYSTQRPANSNNSSTTTTTEIKTSKPSPKPHTYGIHRLFTIEGDEKTKQITKSSTPLRTYQGTWTWSDIEEVNTFAEHLANVFQPHPSEHFLVAEEALIHYIETPYQLDHRFNRLLRSEAHAVAKNLNSKKSPGYDLITGKILQELPVVVIQYLTQIFNAVMLTGHLQAQWKVAQIILILKPGEPPTIQHPTAR